MMGQANGSSVGGDLRRGADAIADFLYGGRGAKYRRRVYHLIETNQLPHFRLGAIVCARESTLLAWIEEQERRSVKTEAA